MAIKAEYIWVDGSEPTKKLRSKTKILPGPVMAACEKFRPRAELHVANYGVGIEERLTGKHETASYKTFLYGVGKRGASIRIPLHCEQAGKGYLEDRRPCANIDPYVVARLIVETTCG